MSTLNITDLTCTYRGYNKPILSGLNLSLKEGEIACLLGKSGCGKSTLLKAIAGLITPKSGSIELHGKLVSTPTHLTPPERRGIGMIFQDYALFPHLTVFDNVAFSLRKHTAKQVRRRVQEMLELVNLNALNQRYPHELSGGQQQRVAIARALANNPSVLLLDEPFSNIDSQVRQHLVREIRDILKQQNVAGLFVTHSREEGFAFADTIAMMGRGRIMQQGTAFELYHQPKNLFIADFMGAGNLLPAKIEDEFHVKTPMGQVKSTSPLPVYNGDQLEIFIRPQMLRLSAANSSERTSPRAKITQQKFMGRSILSEIQLECCQGSYQLISEHGSPVEMDSSVHLDIPPHELMLFDREGQAIMRW